MKTNNHQDEFCGDKEVLRLKKEELNIIIDLGLDLMIITDIEANILMTNPSWFNILGYSFEELIQMNCFDLIHPDDRQKTLQVLKDKVQGEISLYTNRLCDKAGEYHHIEWNIWIMKDRIYAQGRDITPIMKIDQALKESEERYRLLAENTMDVIFIYNVTQKRFTYFTPSISALTGFTPQEAMTRSLEEMVTFADREAVKKKLKLSLLRYENDPSDRCELITESRWICKDGSLVWVETSTKFKPNENDLEIIGVSRNVENRKKSEADLLYISYHDVATGLYNRRYFEEELRRLDASRHLPISIIMGDINRLKPFNDRFGHDVGDQLIFKAAKALQASCRPDDMVARWGGDEFVILLPSTSTDDAQLVMKRITDKLAQERIMGDPISMALGLATKTEFKHRLEDSLKNAEQNMYKEKFRT